MKIKYFTSKYPYTKEEPKNNNLTYEKNFDPILANTSFLWGEFWNFQGKCPSNRYFLFSNRHTNDLIFYWIIIDFDNFSQSMLLQLFFSTLSNSKSEMTIIGTLALTGPSTSSLLKKSSSKITQWFPWGNPQGIRKSYRISSWISSYLVFSDKDFLENFFNKVCFIMETSNFIIMTHSEKRFDWIKENDLFERLSLI